MKRSRCVYCGCLLIRKPRKAWPVACLAHDDLPALDPNVNESRIVR